MITFIGRAEGGRIKADVLLNGDKISYQHPVSLTLDQWHQLRDMGSVEDSPIWAVTADEYVENSGAELPEGVQA